MVCGIAVCFIRYDRGKHFGKALFGAVKSALWLSDILVAVISAIS